MKKTVYIDGQAGTTGLEIYERLEQRADLEILKIDEALRKDLSERKKMLNQADYVFLCLPDQAAKEAVALIENEKVKVLDASTAHRTDPDWAYGFPELSGAHREKIQNSKRVAVPGCYATGFLALVYPLIAAGILPKDYPVTCHAISGYSGGGKATIAEYEASERSSELDAPRLYALGQTHKHLKEMQAISGLAYPPLFNPIIADYYQGMIVSIPLHTRLLKEKKSAQELQRFFADYYQATNFIHVQPAGETTFLAGNQRTKTNELEIFVEGHDDQVLLVARLDNLGKGASGAAVQCLNILLGIDETTSLTTKKKE
ncbi:MAG: N-acetyl-gamma-glutamyl-phosphate reductase [Enterococcus lemanii]